MKARQLALNASVRWLRSKIAASAFVAAYVQHLVVAHGWRGGQAVGGGPTGTSRIAEKVKGAPTEADAITRLRRGGKQGQGRRRTLSSVLLWSRFPTRLTQGCECRPKPTPLTDRTARAKLTSGVCRRDFQC